MPNEAPSQEIKQEIHEAPQVTNENKIDNPYSTYFPNPEVAQKVKNKIKTYPQIEETFINYLKSNPNILRSKNMFLEKSLNDPEKFEKQINSMIDSCSQEINVFPKEEIQQKEEIQVINNDKKLIEEKQQTTQEKQQTTQEKQQTTQEKQQTTQEKQQTIQEKQVVSEKEKTTDSYKEQINKHIQEIDGKFENLLKDPKNQNLATELNSDSYKNNYKEVAKDFENTAKNLKDKGVSDANIDKLIKFRTAEKIISSKPELQNEQTNDFLISFKKLENELNIPDSKVQDFSTKNVEQISAQIFNPDTGNQNLIKTISEQKQSHAEDFEKLFDSPKDIKELNDLYGKFIPESQNTYKTIEDKQQKQTPLNQTEQDFLNRFKSELEAKKTEFETKTSDSMEQATILGPIMGLADYMDMEIGNTFNFNKSNDIKINNGILSITGNIENKPFTLETNLDKASKLKTSDYLNKIDDKNMSVGNTNKQETPYVMPGQKEIRDHIKTQVQAKNGDLLKESKSLDEYQNTLKQSLCEEVKTLYGCKDLVQIRIEKQMTKNIAAQETLEMINTTIVKDFFNDGKNIGENESPALRNFLIDLDYSLENLSADEIKVRRQSIQEFTTILKNPESPKNAKILQAISPDMIKQTQDNIQKVSSGEETKPNIFDFFNCVKDPKTKMFQVNEFYNLLQENKKPEPNEKAFPHISESRNKNNADTDLEMAFISIEETTTIEYNYNYS